MEILRYRAYARAAIVACLMAGWGSCTRLTYISNEKEASIEEKKGAGETTVIHIFSVKNSPEIENMAVWVYDGMDTAFAAQSGHNAFLLCNPSPNARVLAAVNLASNIERITENKALSDTVTADISRMSDSRITAFASGRKVILPGSNSFSITANRAIAKVRLEQICNNISEGAYSGKPVTVEKVFIINGVGRYRIFPGAETENHSPENGRWWFSPSGMVDKADLDNISPAKGEGLMEAPPLSYCTINTTVAFGGTLQLDIELFTGPNSVSQDNFSSSGASPVQGIWQPRKTRLVVQCSIDGARCYYPVTISDIEPNKIYLVKKLNLVNFGTTAPDQPYIFQEGPGSLTVEEWTEQNLTERI